MEREEEAREEGEYRIQIGRRATNRSDVDSTNRFVS